MRALATVVFSIVMLLSCQPTSTVPETPVRTGDYLGETPPGSRPVVFAEGLVSTNLDVRDTTWSPDGSELYYTLYNRSHPTIVTLTRVDGVWGSPEIAGFSGSYPDLEAFVTPAGDALYFASRRPLEPGGDEKDWDLWVTRRTPGGWGEPRNLGPIVNSGGGEYYPSLTADGSLYFTATREDSLGGEDIYRSRQVDGAFTAPENLGPAVNSPGGEYNSLIAPDESWLIFGSSREGDLGGGDLFISFRNADGSWRPAVNMGEPFNSPGLDFCPALSPDGKYFFWTSRRVPEDLPMPASYDRLVERLNGPANGSMNIYWVAAELIEPLAGTTVE